MPVTGKNCRDIPADVTAGDVFQTAAGIFAVAVPKWRTYRGSTPVLNEAFTAMGQAKCRNSDFIAIERKKRTG